MQYLAFIDGLRAIAVLAVVIYHLGFHQMSGGFAGVDVFFVISGFLITSIISRDLDKGSFSLKVFYGRRFRRLLPVLALVVIVTLGFAPLFLTSDALQELANSAMGVAVFASNFFFWHTENYFADSAINKPLLHTWSLGVEEQFYAVFPFFLLLISRLKKRGMLAILWLVTLCSFAINLYLSFRYPVSAFYLLPGRIWEFGAGALLAVHANALGDLAARLRNMLSTAGLILLVYGLFSISSQDVFPGYISIFPVFGAALLIGGGLGGSTIVTRILCLAPLRYIGLISYSLYLWHWVIISFAANWLDDTFTLSHQLLLLVLMFLFSVASYHFVEKPFRTSRPLLKIPSIPGGVALLAIIMLSALGSRFLYFKSPEVIAPATTEWFFPARIRISSCEFGPGFDVVDNTCVMGEKTSQKLFILWGDSHALHMLSGFDKAGLSANWAGLNAGQIGCPSLLGVYNAVNPDKCSVDYGESIRHFVLKNQVDHVFLVARWPMYQTGVRYRGAFKNLFPPFLSDEVEIGDSPESASRVLERSLKRTVDFLAGRGIAVSIVAPVPVLPYRIGKYNPESRPLTQSDYLKQREAIDAVLEKLDVNPLVSILDPLPVFCPDEYCRLFEGETPLYIDHNHLTDYGSEFLVESIVKHLRAGKTLE